MKGVGLVGIGNGGVQCGCGPWVRGVVVVVG